MHSRTLITFLCLAAFIPSTHAACDACGVAPRIIDGTNVPQSAFPTVGLIGDSESMFFYCSGTLIAPRFVLSAAHCVVNGASGQPDFAPEHGLFKLGGATYKTVRVYFNPSYKGDKSQDVEGAVDLSIWELDQDVPGVAPSPLNRTTPTVGQQLTLAGYGELGTGSKGADGTFPPDGTLNTGHAPLEILTPTFIKWNFKNIAPPNNESDTAPGDSGGPQFITADGMLKVASVTSGGTKANSSFGDQAYNTRVDIAIDWIDSITGGPFTPGNNPPVIQSASYNPTPAVPGQEVAFTVTATDADNDPLRYHWTYGDGTEDTNAGAAPTHTYPLDGTYNVTVIVTDGRGGAVEQPLSVQVGTGVPPLMHPLNPTKQRLTLNFSKPASSILDVTLQSPNFQFTSKTAFLNEFNTDTVDVYLGTQLVDHLQVPLNSVVLKGLGKLSFDYRSGSVRYTRTHDVTLNMIMSQFGAVNSSVTTTVMVPINIFINSVLYSGTVTFHYSAVRDRIGRGQ